MSTPERPVVRVGSPAGVLAVIPYLLGFVPEASLVVAGTSRRGGGRIHFLMRYDLPDPPDADLAAGVSEHAMAGLEFNELRAALVAGYGPGHLVTPLADALRQAAGTAGVHLMDVLRVEGGRYWSYLCTDPACCPAEGVVMDPAHRAAAALAAAGLGVLPSRAALAAVVAPVTGPEALVMARATERAERQADQVLVSGGPRAIEDAGRAAVQAALVACREGRMLSPAEYAWLSVVLILLPVRDDAWARMEPAHHRAHQQLWIEVTRRARPGFVAAPACLLAFTSWQAGEGALASLALDRALEDDPDYSMAKLLRNALAMLLPPSKATPPMTPEAVAVSYARQAASDPRRARTGKTGPDTLNGGPDPSASTS